MNYKLENIVAINSGVYLKPSLSGDHIYLNAKHFDIYGNTHEMYFSSTNKVELSGRNVDHSLQDEDLLLVAKGERNKLCYYSKAIGKAVGSSTFIVLRCDKSIVQPKFLFWLLNTTLMQRNLSRLSKGTHVKSISIKVLSKLVVSIPSLHDQDYFINMNDLIMQENKIQKELIGLKELYYDNLLIKNLTMSNKIPPNILKEINSEVKLSILEKLNAYPTLFEEIANLKYSTIDKANIDSYTIDEQYFGIEFNNAYQYENRKFKITKTKFQINRLYKAPEKLGNIVGNVSGHVIDISGGWRYDEGGKIEITVDDFDPIDNLEVNSI